MTLSLPGVALFPFLLSSFFFFFRGGVCVGFTAEIRARSDKVELDKVRTQDILYIQIARFLELIVISYSGSQRKDRTLSSLHKVKKDKGCPIYSVHRDKNSTTVLPAPIQSTAIARLYLCMPSSCIAHKLGVNIALYATRSKLDVFLVNAQ